MPVSEVKMLFSYLEVLRTWMFLNYLMVAARRVGLPQMIRVLDALILP